MGGKGMLQAGRYERVPARQLRHCHVQRRSRAVLRDAVAGLRLHVITRTPPAGKIGIGEGLDQVLRLFAREAFLVRFLWDPVALDLEQRRFPGRGAQSQQAASGLEVVLDRRHAGRWQRPRIGKHEQFITLDRQARRVGKDLQADGLVLIAGLVEQGGHLPGQGGFGREHRSGKHRGARGYGRLGRQIFGGPCGERQAGGRQSKGGCRRGGQRLDPGQHVPNECQQARIGASTIPTRRVQRAHPDTAPGVRPSPGTAAREWAGVLECLTAALAPDVAAPGDGRTPVRPPRRWGQCRDAPGCRNSSCPDRLEAGGLRLAKEGSLRGPHDLPCPLFLSVRVVTGIGAAANARSDVRASGRSSRGPCWGALARARPQIPKPGR